MVPYGSYNRLKKIYIYLVMRSSIPFLVVNIELLYILNLVHEEMFLKFEMFNASL